MTVTFTTAGSWAGVTQVKVPPSTKLDATVLVSNVTTAPATKPDPVTVTFWPPERVPAGQLTSGLTVGAGSALRASDMPADLPDHDHLYPDPDEWLNPGDSVIVAPGGRIVTGPLHEEYGTLSADVDPAAADAAHYTLDTAGHYARPDVFRLEVDRRPRPQVAFADAPDEA